MTEQDETGGKPPACSEAMWKTKDILEISRQSKGEFIMDKKESITKEYALLFNGITNTIEELEGLLLRLKRMQSEAEELYLSREEED